MSHRTLGQHISHIRFMMIPCDIFQSLLKVSLDSTNKVEALCETIFPTLPLTKGMSLKMNVFISTVFTSNYFVNLPFCINLPTATNQQMELVIEWFRFNYFYIYLYHKNVVCGCNRTFCYILQILYHSYIFSWFTEQKYLALACLQTRQT